MTKNKNAFMAGFAEVKKNGKKAAWIRSEKKSMKYGLKVYAYSDCEEECGFDEGIEL